MNAFRTTIIRLTACCLAAAFVTCGCRQESGKSGSTRSMYYWSTTFVIDSLKQAFLREHGVSRLYVRYFDVVQGRDGRPVPNATIRFESPVPEGVEVVPTVFIVNECMTADVGDMAQKLVQRILQMNETHDRGKVHEVQIDCDWTATTEQRFFAFLTDVRRLLSAQGITLSATIRLHQLSGAVPPVDRGVLMMYNTGDLTDLHCEHPILDMTVAKPYLRHLAGYKLPLCAAYPLFRWELVFRGRQFVGILHGDDIPTMAGDSIVVREPTLEEVADAQHTLANIRADIHDEVILFDLSNYNITRFNSEDYETILDP